MQFKFNEWWGWCRSFGKICRQHHQAEHPQATILLRDLRTHRNVLCALNHTAGHQSRALHSGYTVNTTNAISRGLVNADAFTLHKSNPLPRPTSHCFSHPHRQIPLAQDTLILLTLSSAVGVPEEGRNNKRVMAITLLLWLIGELLAIWGEEV